MKILIGKYQVEEQGAKETGEVIVEEDEEET